MVDDPVVSFYEIYDTSSIYKLAKTITSTTMSVVGDLVGKNTSRAYTLLRSYSGSFDKNMLGATFTITSPQLTAADAGNYISSKYTGTIVEVINSSEAMVYPNFMQQRVGTLVSTSLALNSSSVNILYTSTSIDYTSPNQIQSYINVSVKKLSTYSSYIKYVDLYKNPGKQYVGRFPVVANDLLQDGYFSSLSDFQTYWQITSQSGDPTVTISFGSTRLRDAIRLQNISSTGTYRIYNSTPLYFSKGTEYEVTAKLIAVSTSSTETVEMDVYFTGSQSSAFLRTDSNGHS
jgi:hypothetical protein